MLLSLKPLHEYVVAATDGYLGKVNDFYFHDTNWVVRYMVVDIGHWLTGRKVLLATTALGRPEWGPHSFPVDLTKDQIEKSTPIDTDQPVSRQQEAELHQHFGWPYYWSMSEAPDPLFAPPQPFTQPNERIEPEAKGEGDPHLRSVREMTRYHVHASDGDVGHISDFIVEDSNWVIRYLVVSPSNWLLKERVLMAPAWLKEIDFSQRRVEIALTREKILGCPKYHPAEAVNREYEERLYDYYGRPVNWTRKDSADKAGHGPGKAGG